MPIENALASSAETAAIGCSETSDTSENSSSFCLCGSGVSLNIALTQQLTSERLAMIPRCVINGEVDSLQVLSHQAIEGDCGQDGSACANSLQIRLVKIC